MEIRYLAHSSFLITTDGGTRVLFDPYESGGYGGAMRYGPIRETADVVVNTHRHADHGHTAGLPGKPEAVDGLDLSADGPRAIKDVTLSAVHTFHDPNQGKERGENAVILLKADGLTLAHLGDLGHTLDPVLAHEICPVDILLIPVGGHFTIDAAQATEVMNALRPKITIPMHFKTDRVDFPIAPVEGFLAGKRNVRRPGGSTLSVEKGTLPAQAEIVVLEPSL